MRWRIERDYLELKQEIGLGHYERRGWPGFHHHATLCIAVYGFLISERETIPPSGPHCARRAKNLPFPIVTVPRSAANPAPTPPTIARSMHQLIVAIAGHAPNLSQRNMLPGFDIV